MADRTLLALLDEVRGKTLALLEGVGERDARLPGGTCFAVASAREAGRCRASELQAARLAMS